GVEASTEACSNTPRDGSGCRASPPATSTPASVSAYPPARAAPGSRKSTATGAITDGRHQTGNGSCSPRHTSQFVVRCNQPTRVDVIETSWPAERGCTERFRGKPASINASHQRSTAALAIAVGKE